MKNFAIAFAIAFGFWPCVACVSATKHVECTDGLQNGGETAVDCGGPQCAACPSGLGCVLPSDCASALCANGTCLPLPAPGIAAFTAGKSVLTVGGSTTLTAVFSVGTGSIDSGVGAVQNGQAVIVGPFASAGSTTYTLSVSDNAGTTMTQSLTVTVVPVAAITAFSANPNALSAGQSTQLTAVFSDGNATLDPNVGAVQSGVAASSGALQQDTHFTLTVTNAAGDAVTRGLDVAVAAMPLVVHFAAAASVVTAGDSIDLMPNFAGGSGSIDQGVGAVQSGTPVTTGPLNANTTFTLTVNDNQGHTDVATVQVTVVPPPAIANWVANANSVLVGQSVQLTATFSQGSGSVGGVGPVTSGVAATTPTLTGNSNFVLTVTNAAGRAVTRGYAVSAVAVADCMQVRNSGLAQGDGVYPVGPNAASLRNVWCDLTTDGGGWMRLYHGVNGAAHHFASFEDADSCSDTNTQCLQHMPAAAGSDVQLLVSCGAAQVRFTPSAGTVAYLKAGTVANWQNNTHAVSLNGGHVAAASAFLAGDSGGSGWLLNVTADLTVPQVFGNASTRTAASLQGCGGDALDSNSVLSLAYREPVRRATSLLLTAPPVANLGASTPVQVSLLDQYGELFTGGVDSIVISSGDSAAGLPANANLVAGALTQNVTFNTAGAHGLNASNSVLSATTNVTGVANAVGTAASPAQSCNDIVAHGAGGGDGVYTVRAANANHTVYCDMTYSGGGWTLLLATGEQGPALLAASAAVIPSAPGTLPVALAQALAQTATQVHIRSAGLAASQSITSVAANQFITNLQNGVQLSSNQTYSAASWTGPYNAALYTAFDSTCTADAWPAVYRACGHGGLMLAGNDTRWQDNGGSLYGNTALEVYVR